MNVVIGSSREQKLPSLVLEHTILEHASVPVRVIHTYDMKFPSPKKPENVSRTGFSFNRFAIPKLVGYSGIAAYLECDQIVFFDVKELFGVPFEGATILRPPNQASVLLLDCEKLKWDLEKIVRDLDSGKYTYHSLMVETCIEAAGNIKYSIPNDWNSLERYVAGETKLLHYTNMAMQPWRKWGHPLGHLWMRKLRDAMKAGRVSLFVVEEEVRLKHIVPEVLKEACTWTAQ